MCENTASSSSWWVAAMHESVREWVADVVERYKLRGVPTLEVGSMVVNGTVRPLFAPAPGFEYLGVDMRPGVGVNKVVAPGSPLPHRECGGRWPVIVSTEMLEHDRNPFQTFVCFAEALVPGGLAIVTTRWTPFPEHDHPSDNWRFSHGAMRILSEFAGLDVLEQADDPLPGHSGVFLVARKPEVDE